uniref:Uncharacterized protein n=1 Tax=Oryza glaberrima TaxID=4538 RepID=I1PBF5_ORYGL
MSGSVMMMQRLARQAAARVVTQHARSGSGSGLAGAVRGYNNVSASHAAAAGSASGAANKQAARAMATTASRQRQVTETVMVASQNNAARIRKLEEEVMFYRSFAAFLLGAYLAAKVMGKA